MKFKKTKILLLTLLTGLGMSTLCNISNASTIYGYHNDIPKPSRKIYNQNQLPLKSAESALAMNRKTGQLIYEKNANTPRLPASTSKVMTLYLAERKLARHPNDWHHRISIPNNIVDMKYNHGLDGYDFKANKKYTIAQIFKSAFIGSADNSATLLGEWTGNSNNSNFVRMMNKQAQLWHLKNTHFTSASGLENNDLAPYGLWCKDGYYSGNEVSAKDLAIITYHLIHQFPNIMKYSKYQSYDGMRNENSLLPHRYFYDKHLHVDGLKTGYTPRAGLCFIGTNHNHHGGTITVILHDGWEFPDTKKLMKFSNNHSYQATEA